MSVPDFGCENAHSLHAPQELFNTISWVRRFFPFPRIELQHGLQSAVHIAAGHDARQAMKPLRLSRYGAANYVLQSYRRTLSM
jgi:hypothetical protein